MLPMQITAQVLMNCCPLHTGGKCLDTQGQARTPEKSLLTQFNAFKWHLFQ